LRALGAEVEIGPAAPRESRSRRRGEPACFALLSSHEITCRGRKLIGSAQLRRRGAFLQHGSIPIRADPSRLAAALGSAELPARFTDLTAATGQAPEIGRLDGALVAAFESGFQARLVPGELNAAERVRATRLYAWKYASTSWTYQGRWGAREARLGPLNASGLDRD
jgi:lipoate-protein ligase A